jgi:hypothetical protein
LKTGILRIILGSLKKYFIESTDDQAKDILWRIMDKRFQYFDSSPQKKNDKDNVEIKNPVTTMKHEEISP